MQEELAKLYKAAPLYRELFDKQLEFALSPNRFLGALCTRRAGKTTVCAVKALNELATNPNKLGMYLALTDESVKDIFMPVATPLIYKYGLKCKVNKDEIIFDNGSKLIICGANNARKIETFRGVKLLFCIVDEAASYDEKLLHYLIDEIVGPALSDLQGQLIMIGTPKAHCKGLFYEVTKGIQKGWDVKQWTAFENPYQARQHQLEIEAFCVRKQCDKNHPKLLREYYGQWIADDDSLMIKPFYLKDPGYYDTNMWRSVIGVDFGFNDYTAFSVITWQRDNPVAYVAECYGKAGMSVSEIAKELQRLNSIYEPVSIVGDPAGASKIMMKEFADKYSIFMEPAEKTNKAHYIEILNDALINRELLLHPNTIKLQQEMKTVVWNEDRTREFEGGTGYCDHLDATLYGFRAAFAYIEKIPVKKVKTEKDFEDEMLQQLIESDRRQNEERDDFFDEISAVLED